VCGTLACRVETLLDHLEDASRSAEMSLGAARRCRVRVCARSVAVRLFMGALLGCFDLSTGVALEVREPGGLRE
jgi:hypothetical protein